MRRARNGTVDLKRSCSPAPVRLLRSAVPTKEQCGVCEKRRAPYVARSLRARQEFFQEFSRWIGFSEDDEKTTRRRRKYQAAKAVYLPTRCGQRVPPKK